MTRIRSTFVAAVMLSLVSAAAADAGWLHFANAVVQAEEAIQKHPAKLTQAIVVPIQSRAPLACAGYSNNVAQSGKGKITTLVRVEAADGRIETKKLVGRVRNGFAMTCKKLDKALAAGDLVFFEHVFKKFPRLRIEGKSVDFAEIASIISTAGVPGLAQKAPLGFGPAKGTAPLNLLPSPGPGWYHSSRSLFQATADGQKHPQTLARTVFIPGERANPRVCVGYNNIADATNKGRVVARGLLTRADGSLETLKFIGPVRGNRFLTCKSLSKKLRPGAFIEFFATFKGMPKLESSGDVIGFADFVAAVSTSGNPVFREPEPEPEPPKSDPPPPTSPPQPPPGNDPPGDDRGGDGISAADEIAVSTLLILNKGVQLWRSKDDQPRKWTVVGPKTRAVPGTNQLIASTAGYGDDPASALADYERKQGSLGRRGSRLSSRELAGLKCYSTMSSRGGPTSVRRSSTGKYYGEYYRPGHGAQHQGPLSSLSAAFDWIKSRLGC